jgi:hypothetical protein
MDSRLPWDFPAADPNGGMRSLAAEVPRGRRLIAVLLLASAAMDLMRPDGDDRPAPDAVYRFRTRRWCCDLLFAPVSWLRQDRGLCPSACST